MEFLPAEKRRNSNSWVSSCGCSVSSGSGCCVSSSAAALGVLVGFEGAGSVKGMGPYKAARRECSADSRDESATGSREEGGEREL